MIKRVNEIPTDLYIKIPSLIYNTWKKQFIDISRYHVELTNKKLRIPKENGRIITQSAGTRFYTEKPANEPLDLEYTITFRIELIKFNTELQDFFNHHNIDFDFDLFYDKSKLLLDISTELNLRLGVKMIINYDAKYIIFVDHVVLKTKSDIIELY